jgi:uncharacterized protein YuzE
MELRHDQQADAIYIYLSSKPYAYGKDLDDERRIDYASDNSPIGVELLCVSKGVNVAGLPRVDEIAEVLQAKGIKIYAMEQYVETSHGYSNAVFSVKMVSPTQAAEHTARLREEVTV